jgi:HAMP domain-containing protein
MADPTLEHPDGGRPRPGGRRVVAGALRQGWPGAAGAALRRLAQRCSYGLTRKFSLFLIGLLTALTATLIGVSTLAEQRVTEERLRQRAEDSVRLLADAAAGTLAAGHVEDLHRLLVRVAGRDEVLYVHVVDRQGGLIASGDPDGALSSWLIGDPLAAAGDAAASLRLRDDRGLHAAQPVMLAGRAAGSLRLGLSTAEMERDLLSLSQRNLMVGITFLAGSLLLGLPLVRRITRPLAQLTESAEAASHGEFDRRIAIDTNDEVGLLAASFNRMLSQLTESIAQVRRLAYFDSVTDLPNRIHFQQLLGRTLGEARRHGRRAAVLYLDVDRFKLVNDSFGHAAGDLLLQAFARRLSAAYRLSGRGAAPLPSARHRRARRNGMKSCSGWPSST